MLHAGWLRLLGRGRLMSDSGTSTTSGTNTVVASLLLATVQELLVLVAPPSSPDLVALPHPGPPSAGAPPLMNKQPNAKLFR